MNDKTDILLVIPPLLQPNCPYPATPYLTGYLKRKGYRVEQLDLSVELLNSVFSSRFLEKVFSYAEENRDKISPGIDRIYRLKRNYISSIDTVMKFLRGEDDTIANLICGADFLPQAGRFESMEDIEYAYGQSGNVDCAKYLATLYLEDLSDFLQEVVSPHFGLTRYAESIALSVPEFKILKAELDRPLNIIEEEMLDIFGRRIRECNPSFIGFTVPFPGNLLSALRCGEYVKRHYPDKKVIIGGGYPTTELRSLTDSSVFDFTDYILLDDGEIPLERLLSGGEMVRTYGREGKKVVYSGNDDNNISHSERGCSDYSGLPLGRYFSLAEVANPMQRLWGDGFWNKLMAAHGCYWAKCSFCDTKLDYICRYDALDAVVLVDYMENVISQTGKTGFHFVDEALPPKLLKDMSLEILRRGLIVSWWGNIRFEQNYTSDLCKLLAASGCIAVSGGVETASDRLLELMKKGVSIEQLTITLRNFYYAGVMVHTYLMYGFPTQTAQEVVDSLEVVRQMFRADLIGSAFWHRYAMTRHSYSGNNPAEYEVRIKADIINKFANNEVQFAENRNYDINAAGEGLRAAIYNYMHREGLDKPVHKWFAHKMPEKTIEETLITDHLIKPDKSRMYDDNARLIYIGISPVKCDEGLSFAGNSSQRVIKFESSDADFMMEVISKASQIENKLLFYEIQQLYGYYNPEKPFSYLYHSKNWDRMREYGLLQI